MIRAILFLSALLVALAVLGCTGERLSARLALLGAALLSAAVGCWVLS